MGETYRHYLEATGDAVLTDVGKKTAEFAKSFAESEFEKYLVVPPLPIRLRPF